MDAGLKKEQNISPRTNANIFSLITFWWLRDIFKLGYREDLEIKDLYDALQEHRSDFLGNKLEKLWNQELQRGKTWDRGPSLFRVLARCFGVNAVWLGLTMIFCEFFFRMTQPIFLGGLIRYFSPGGGIGRDTAYLYAAGIVVCSTFNVFAVNPIWLAAYHAGMKMRVGICSLIYRKALRLSRTALGEATVGQAVNLLSNDVARFDSSFVFLPFLVIGPVETAAIVYLMWTKIGISAIIGVATLLLFIPVQAGFGKMISTLRMCTARRTDERIKFMNEIVVGIQVIKLYAWEKPFAHLIALARKHEIKAIRASCFVMGLLSAFGRFGTKLAVFASVVSYVLQNGRLTAEEVFVVTAYFNILKHVMTESFPLAVIEVAESTVSIKRVQAFLLNEEVASAATQEGSCGKITTTLEGSNKPCECRCSLNDTELVKDPVNTKISDKITTVDTVDRLLEKTGGPTSKKSIVITNVTAKWMEDLPKNTLTDVSLDVRPGELVAVVGPVGSGKTSLLHAILKELPLNSGSISVGGSVSYASQEPWLFTGSVRQNILFGQPMDRNRYRQVVRVCALERDFQLLPHSDRTIVGERGVTLSGGQRARISLARAVYKEADIYLLDDPLSAVDTRVGRHLFEDCICGFLVGKTKVLVTHQLQYLHTADDIIILNNGAVEARGTYTELRKSGVDFAKKLAVGPEEHEDEEKPLANSTQSPVRRNVRHTSESSTVSSMSWSEPQMLAEMRSRGGVSFSVYRAYCAAGGSCGITLLVFGVCILAQFVFSLGDYWMSYWSDIEEQRASQICVPANNTSMINVTFTVENDISSPFCCVNSTIIAATNCTELEWLPSTETCILVYTGFIIAIIVLAFSSVFSFFAMCMRASVNLHNAMFTSITRATMQFFNNNPSGQILNRFSKDMGSVDESLPRTMIDCVQIGLALIGVVLVVAVVNFWLLIPAAVMFAFIYVLRVCYVSTSRSIKRLEGITRSPVFSHLSASLQGLTTIRAFGNEALLEKEFDSHQDLHSSAWFMFIASSRAFALWLDFACLMYIGLVTFSFLFLNRGPHGGDVGLAITQSIGLIGMIQWGMRQSAELENNMTSLERVLEYTSLESEPPLESPSDKKPHRNWPNSGIIVFDEVVLAYSKDGPPVLKCVSFTVMSSEKVGIVGRTGAGKSSLIAALFRLAGISSGQIQIDGIDIASVGLHDLRSKISIIPQEPVLFSGSLRENLDPFSEYSDAALWAALAEVELKQVVDELPAGLSHRVSEGGSNFSVGQRQLLCLARAIIRNNKILVLDEATANVDPQTDELIQATIRRKFADCTVLTVAHRLHTVMDSNRILVMDAGHVVEFDQPYILLKNKNSVLSWMVEQTGHAMAESLFRVAQTTYEGYLENTTKKKF